MTTATTLVPNPPRTPQISGAGMTHRGQVRTGNEDAILTDPSGVLWAVADGMGGHGHGDVASDIVIDHLSRIEDTGAPASVLFDALTAANADVRHRQVSDGLGGMGTTVVAMLIDRSVAHIAWAGDSRAYLLRKGALDLLTRDHSVVQDLVDQGALRPEDAEAHPESNVITRAIGGAPEVEIDQLAIPLTGGDRLLLCTDGLSRVVDRSQIAAIPADTDTPSAACHGLLSAALDAGAPDNVSAIVVDVGTG